MDFRRSYPKIADFLEKKEPITRKNQLHSRWHWLTLILFGLLTVATFTQQIFLLLVSIVIVALLKGPGMIFLGTIYAFLVGLFPPIGIVLSAIFFLLNLGTLAKNWRLSLTGIFFYGYPIAAMFLRVWRNWDNIWFLTGSLAIGLLVLHLLLTKIYQRYGIGRTIFWYLFSLPFVFLTALLPKRLKRRIKLLPKS
ncbi:hypothetical protein [Enterococcus durans]|uniref:Integral membrane protein n=2 Tax=Enterococcus durans TaxID=53345 RepID=A0AB36SA58_9ENTE|nr:hypothetical protein [Enterococcus durans]EOT29562.1 hypothetical protein OMS_02559 [Enterococcus durans ATCC 6056]EOU22684.1 hypothetical protein I571_01255 [Enterococcus durans ATCC 6056]PEH45586.1 hypothetical protein CRM96_11515 [Enterococcus durans]QPQ26766.1 hypothetical protein I4Q39_11240 [Enterococcus durans]QXB38554.1 hypothetical protein I6L67_05240 [Enterococcus durans]